jgi:replication factor C subunit 3/5
MLILNYMDTLPWIEKYRPIKLDDIVGHVNIINTFKKCINKQYLPHTLLYGPPGTGKTSTILAFAREFYGKYHNFMVLELNASDDRGIEVVRDTIKKFVSNKYVFFGNGKDGKRREMFKLVILDEIDAMTHDAQSILRKVIEEHSINTRFCLICNYIQKILPALQSRFTKFRFAPILPQLLENTIINICNKENIDITLDGIISVIKHSDGDIRKVLNILQSTSMIYKQIDEDGINTCRGYPTKKDMKYIIDALLNKSFSDAHNIILTIKIKSGISLTDIISELHDILYSKIIENGNNIDININIERILYIISKLKNIDFYQSVTLNDDIQLSAIIGIFKENTFI